MAVKKITGNWGSSKLSCKQVAKRQVDLAKSTLFKYPRLIFSEDKFRQFLFSLNNGIFITTNFGILLNL